MKSSENWALLLSLHRFSTVPQHVQDRFLMKDGGLMRSIQDKPEKSLLQICIWHLVFQAQLSISQG